LKIKKAKYKINAVRSEPGEDTVCALHVYFLGGEVEITEDAQGVGKSRRTTLDTVVDV
jgi:hypothetical protein